MPDDKSDIVFSDPAEPFVFKPVIEDLLRTRFCIPGSVFLVEGVEPLIPVRKLYRGARLLVSDGISCVQAVLKGEAHGLVDNGQIYAGCYVRVGSFELRFLEMSEDVKDDTSADGGRVSLDGDVERKKKRGAAARTMVYLVLENPVTVGWDAAYLKILEAHKQLPSAELAVISEEPGPNPKRPRLDTGKEDKPAPGKETLQMTHLQAETSPDYGIVSEPNPAGVGSMGIAEMERPQPVMDSAKPPAKAAKNASQPSSEVLPWSTDDPTKPVKLTPLRRIPNLPYKQNWVVNILAVVASISDVEPSHLPPYHQRIARLADPSTSKQVLLTVFLDPDDFNPAVGKVVLILGVKNHRFDGGSLKKYASDRPKNGTRWWFEEPSQLEWCDVAGLRGWWESKRAAG